MTHEQSSGFTLIEVMLAVMIAAMLMTGVFWSLDQAVATRTELSNRATPYVVGPAILDVMSRDLANVYFYDLKENNSFYATDRMFADREMDAISFVTTSRTFAPDRDNFRGRRGDIQERHSFMNEVAYVLRPNPQNPHYFELWRREDFFVDEHVHANGDFVQMYDKVYSFSLQFVRRNTQTQGGVGGQPRELEAEDMLKQEGGWNSVEERGLPRAVLITLLIYARDGEWEVGTTDEPPRLYRFQRYVTLPQVHVTTESERQIADWDGSYNEGAQAAASGSNPGGGSVTRAGTGQGGPAPGGLPGGNQRQRGRGRNQGGQQGAAGAGGNNPFLQALQGRGGGGRPSGGGAGNLGAIFGGGR